MLVACFGINNFGGPFTISTPPSGWTVFPNVNNIAVGGNFAEYMYYKISDGTETTVSATLSGAGWGSIGFVEYRGPTGIRTNGTAGQESNSTTPTSGTTVGSASAGDLVVSCLSYNNTASNVTVSSLGGATGNGRILSPSAVLVYGTVGGMEGAIEDNLNASAGTTAGTWNQSGGGDAQVGVGIFTGSSVTTIPPPSVLFGNAICFFNSGNFLFK